MTPLVRTQQAPGFLVRMQEPHGSFTLVLQMAYTAFSLLLQYIDFYLEFYSNFK